MTQTLTKPLFMSARCLLLTLLLGVIPAVVMADTRILLDIGRSMDAYDPEQVRTQALELLFDALPDGERAGVWTFGQYVNLLVPYQSVDTSWRGMANARLEAQEALAERTNIGNVLQKAAFDFSYSSYSGPIDVILITDGEVDISPNTEVNRVERERIISQLVPRFVAAQAAVHTLGLSDKADHALLQLLSQQTGGRYQRVEQSADLPSAMMSLIAELVPTTQLSLTENRFSVDASVRELTILAYHDRGAIALKAPDGNEAEAVRPGEQRWRVGKGFTQATVTNPLPGSWQVLGPVAAGANVRVISDINVRWVSPASTLLSLGSSQALELQLVDSQAQPLATDLADLIVAAVEVNGRPIATEVRQDRIMAQLPEADQATEIRVAVRIDGGTFNRLAERQFRFVQPYLSEVLLAEDAYEWRLYQNRLVKDSGDIQAMASYQQGTDEVSEPFMLTDAGYWVWRLPYSNTAGVYQVRLSGQLGGDSEGSDLRPEVVELRLPPSLNQPMTMMPGLAESVSATEGLATEMPASTPTDESYRKDVMPEFAELQADVVVNIPTDADQWAEEPLPANEPSASDVDLLTYLLLSIPGVLILLVAYLFYRRLEHKAQGLEGQQDLIISGEEFSALDDMENLQPDEELHSTALDDKAEKLADSTPFIDDVVELDHMDAEASAKVQQQPEQPDTESNDAEGDVFDISDIDDDLTDLDLALDGDDPFSNINEKKDNS